MNLLLLFLSTLAANGPTSAGVPVGPWIHFIWVLIIFGLIIGVVWWLWSRLSGYVPEPIRTIIAVLGCVVLAILIIVYVLLPLMGAF